MRTVKPRRHPARKSAAQDVAEEEAEFPEGFPDEVSDEFLGEDAPSNRVRVRCPDCAQAVALDGLAVILPEHALCPTPWKPFGLTVCPGSGRTVTDADTLAAAPPVPGELAHAALAVLPEGLHWRFQPFSHLGAARARAVRLPAMRQAA